MTAPLDQLPAPPDDAFVPKADGSLSKIRYREIRNLSEGSAYAYGFTDKKPGVGWWVVQVGMVLGLIWMIAHGALR